MRAETPLRVEAHMVAPATNPDSTQAPTPPDASSSRSLPAAAGLSVSSSLSDRDARLVAALVNPSPEGDVLLAAFDPAEHADWLDRPEIQRAIAAGQAFRDLRLRAKAAQRAERAMDRLDAVLDHASDLKDDAQRTETRRAASVLARISTQCLAWAAGAPSSPSPTRPRSTSGLSINGPRPSPAHLFTCSPAQAPPDLPRLVTYAPDRAVAGILARLRALSDPSPSDAFKSLSAALDYSINIRPSLADRFTDELAESPAFTARDHPVRAEPVRIEGGTATQRIVFTMEDRREAACIFTLVEHRQPDPASPPIWLTRSIRAEDSS